MPSTYSASLRLELQAAGENLNTWGAPKLNAVISRLDFSVAGWTTKALTGNYTLTSSNSDDEARSAMLKFTGAGGYTVTIPSVSKAYDVYNACSASIIVTTGAGEAATIIAGECIRVICNGSDVHKQIPTDFDGLRLTNLANPTGAQDGATKAYADALAFTANAGILPGMVGSDGKFLGVVAGASVWAYVTVASISDYASDQATKTLAATKLAIAYAASI